MKKILLLNPYTSTSDHIQPPLGLAYLAASLRKNGFKVVLVDANKERAGVKQVLKIISQNNPDFIGVQFYSQNYDDIKQLLLQVKLNFPQIITIVGGPHPSALPGEILKEFGKLIDFAFCGEAELGLPKLLKNIASPKHFKSIAGLIFRKENKIIVNPPYFSPDLDQFDYPAWDLIKPQNYPPSQHGAFFKNFPIAPIITTRGCPFGCNFCSAGVNSGTLLRTRSVNNVVTEIKDLYTRYRIREFHIVDDNFTLAKTYAEKMLSAIINLKLKASFAVPNGVRLDTLDDELLFLMKQAGFYLISVGIESGSDRILKKMNKHITVDKIKEKLLLIKKHKLDVAGFFILGYPGETEEEINKTIAFSLNLGLLRANFFLFQPLPGTQVAKKFPKNSLKIDYGKLSFTKPSFSNHISSTRLKNLQKQAFLRFYLRPKILISNLVRVRKPLQVLFLFKRVCHWLF